jgi:hypothetical protein
VIRVLGPALLLVACGHKKPPEQPKEEPVVVRPPPPPPETEEDREKKRLAAAHEIIPDGSACLPAVLRESGAPKLEIAAVGSDAVLCAVDQSRDRLLGTVGCWKVDVANNAALAYQSPAPLPGRDIDVKVEKGCARGFCLPKDAKPADTAHMAWNLDSTKVAVLVGDDVHIFDVASKSHESNFSIRGDKGVTNDPFAIEWVGDQLFVEGADQGSYSAVWAFKADGTAVGPLVAIGSKDGKPMSTFGGSFVVLDKNRVAVAEQGFSTVTTYEIDSGKRGKLVRKVAKAPCKADEMDAYWHSNEAAVGAKCKAALDKDYGHLVGADALAGTKNWLVVLRGARLGELAVLDSKSLAEKKVFKLAWCDQAAAPAAP